MENNSTWMAEKLGLVACPCCSRIDRISLQRRRRGFYFECDCGGVGAHGRNLEIATRLWNQWPHMRADGKIVDVPRAE